MRIHHFRLHFGFSQVDEADGSVPLVKSLAKEVGQHWSHSGLSPNDVYCSANGRIGSDQIKAHGLLLKTASVCYRLVFTQRLNPCQSAPEPNKTLGRPYCLMNSTKQYHSNKILYKGKIHVRASLICLLVCDVEECEYRVG